MKPPTVSSYGETRADPHDVMAGTHNRDGVIANVAFLVDKARAENVPVVWVQHSSDDMRKGSDGGRYVPELTQEEFEPVVHKRYPDSFEDTDLKTVLVERKVGRLIITGGRPGLAAPHRSRTTRRDGKRQFRHLQLRSLRSSKDSRLRDPRVVALGHVT